MRAKKWHQRNSTVMRFCFQTFLHTICVTHSVQGFAKKRPTWRLSNRLWGIKTSRLRWTFMPKQPKKKSRNRLNDWLQHWMFFNQRRRTLLSTSIDSKNSLLTAKWQQLESDYWIITKGHEYLEITQSRDSKASRSVVNQFRIKSPRWSLLTSKLSIWAQKRALFPFGIK